MRVNHGLLNWGIFLVALGGVPLVVRYADLGTNLVDDIWRLWPLILVGIGLGLVLKLTPLGWLGGALVAFTFGVMGGAFLTGGIAGVSVACVGTGPTETTSRSGFVAGERFELRMELTCGEVTVARGTDASWRVDATHAEGRPPIIDGAVTSLSVRTDPSGGTTFVPFAGEARNEWQVTVPAVPALDASMTINAAKATLGLSPGAFAGLNGTFNAVDVDIDLSGASPGPDASVNMTLNATSGKLRLPAAALTGNMTLNASSLTLCVDPDVALRVDHQQTLSSDDLGAARSGLTQVGRGWQTAGYDTALVRVELNVRSNVSSLSLDRSGGCP
jgi:hypothetical protein